MHHSLWNGKQNGSGSGRRTCWPRSTGWPSAAMPAGHGRATCRWGRWGPVRPPCHAWTPFSLSPGSGPGRELTEACLSNMLHCGGWGWSQSKDRFSKDRCSKDLKNDGECLPNPCTSSAVNTQPGRLFWGVHKLIFQKKQMRIQGPKDMQNPWGVGGQTCKKKGECQKLSYSAFFHSMLMEEHQTFPKIWQSQRLISKRTPKFLIQWLFTLFFSLKLHHHCDFYGEILKDQTTQTTKMDPWGRGMVDPPLYPKGFQDYCAALPMGILLGGFRRQT